MNDALEWVFHRIHLFLVGFGNAAAWATSIDAGTVATICTVIVPLIVGAVIATFKKCYPEWLNYCRERDKMNAETLAGQIERLNRNLEDERETSAARALLAETNERLARAAREHADELLQQVKAIGVRVEDLNGKNHILINAAAAQEANYLVEKRELQAKLDQANDELAKANRKLAEIDRHVCQDLADTRNQIAENKAEIATIKAESKPDPR